MRRRKHTDDEPRDAETIANVERLRRELGEVKAENKRLRMRVAVLERQFERGRPLTASEQVANLESGLGMEPGRLSRMLLK